MDPVQKTFNIKFNVSELSNLKNVGEIIDKIIKKKNYKLFKLIFKFFIFSKTSEHFSKIFFS